MISMNHDEQKKKNSDALARARAAILSDYRATFGTDAGKRTFAHLRDSAGCGRPSFLPPAGGGPVDSYAAAFRDGRKSICDEIQAHLDTPEDIAVSEPAAIK
jgi:hypothetical protein